MRKVGLLFLVAVLAPSLGLAWLAIRSARQQQLILERQEHLLLQGLASRQAQRVAAAVIGRQREFASEVESLLASTDPRALGLAFHERLSPRWPLAQVGFAVTLEGEMLAPSMFDSPEARTFRLENERFLTSRETVQVFWESPKGMINLSRLDGAGRGAPPRENDAASPADKPVYATKAGKFPNDTASSTGHVAGATEFVSLVGDAMEGTLARFLQDRLTLLFWYRSPQHPQTVFGAQVDMTTLAEGLAAQIQVEPELEVALALLDDGGRPVGVVPPGYSGAWNRPFLSEAIGELLPHWHLAVYQTNPARLGQAARTINLVLGVAVGFLVLAIGAGGWLIVRDLNRHLRLARLKTDFVSNVSHELKTPLTSIRMFSELLAENRVKDSARQRHYLGIISAEASRLTRLINNVLDFSRLDQGQKQYRFERVDLREVIREVAGTFRPHLEESGFELQLQVPEDPAWVRGDRDALAQVLVNLLSNAEKYSGSGRRIDLEVGLEPGGWVQARVLDRGVGIPPASEEKIFEQFYRAHDALNSGIQGSGLGLTLARQIARAHGGDVTGKPRSGGGSCFVLRLPLGGSAGAPTEET